MDMRNPAHQVFAGGREKWREEAVFTKYSEHIMGKMNNESTMTKKVKLSLGWKMVLMSGISLLIMAVALTVFSATTLRAGMQEEATDALQYLASGVRAAYDQLIEGDYYLAEDGSLMKGDMNLSERTDILDAFVADEDAELTLFYGDVRKSTTLVDQVTGERIVGTTASAEVAKTVLGGKDYASYNLTINNEQYYAYYEPLHNSDGSIIGMIFIGMPASGINAFINEAIIKIATTALGITIVAMILVTVFGLRLGKAMRKTEAAIEEVAAGNLTVEIDQRLEKRSDEVGMIMYILRGLVDRLRGVMTDIKESALDVHKYGEGLEGTASQTSTTADEIAGAVEGISKGAISQAEDIEQATVAVDNMGKAIEDIVAKVENLAKTAEQMNEAGDEAAAIMGELSASNDKTMDAVKRVTETVQQTDASVQQIREAVAMITSIASETSLLSLNASIEAARAGESGKGFAVVAEQIRRLADTSEQTANKIQDINQLVIEAVDGLVQTSNKMIGYINENVLADYESFVVGGRQYSEDATHIDMTMKDCANDAKQTLTSIAQMADAVHGISVAMEESAHGVVNAVNNVDALVGNMATVNKKMEENSAVGKALKAEAANFVRV